MQAAPPTKDEEARIAALHRLDILDTEPEAAYDRLVRIASRVCDVPIALVSLVDKERQWFKARIGLDVAETPREVAFCSHAIHDDGLFVVPDVLDDPRFADNPLVTGHPDIRFYAGAPIPAPGGERLGTLCVIDRKPRIMDDTQRAILVLLAEQAAEALVTRRVVVMLRDAVAGGSDVARREALNRLAHELRTPLTPMAMRLASILARTSDDATRRDVRAMQGNMDRLVAAIQETTQVLGGSR